MVQRVVLDTSVYGYLVDDPQIKLLKPILVEQDRFRMIGIRIIRREIKRWSSKKTRSALLHLYDSLTSKELVDDEKTQKFAKEYYSEAKRLGKEKVKSWSRMENDLKIVACASIHGIDIVFTEDRKTMMGEHCLEAYKIVNLRNDVRSPVFYTYGEFKKAFMNEMRTSRI